MTTRLRLLPLLLVPLAACGAKEASGAEVDLTRVTTSLHEVDVPGIDKIQTVGGFYLAGQPSEAGLEAAKAGGIRTVLNVRHADEVGFDEAALVEELGMTYEHVPWNGADELTDDVFDRTRELLRSAEKPVLFHCKSANRVGSTWLAYRVLDDGMSLDAAVAEAKSVGMKSADYEAKARDYIERHKD